MTSAFRVYYPGFLKEDNLSKYIAILVPAIKYSGPEGFKVF